MKMVQSLLAVALILLIGLGIYTYSVQDRLRQTEYKLTALQEQTVTEIDKMSSNVKGLQSEVDKLNTELYGESKSSGPIWVPYRQPTSSRIDKLEDKLSSGGYGSLEWEVDNLKSNVDSIKNALEQKGFRFSWIGF